MKAIGRPQSGGQWSSFWLWTNQFLGDIIQEVTQSRIQIDREKRRKQVWTITETDYFQELAGYQSKYREWI